MNGYQHIYSLLLNLLIVANYHAKPRLSKAPEPKQGSHLGGTVPLDGLCCGSRLSEDKACELLKHNFNRSYLIESRSELIPLLPDFNHAPQI